MTISVALPNDVYTRGHRQVVDHAVYFASN